MSAASESTAVSGLYSASRHRRLVLKTAPVLLRLRMAWAALLLLKDVERRGHANTEVIEALYKTYIRLGMTAKAVEYRAKILRGRATRAARAKGLDRPVQNLLRALAGLEQLKLAAPLAASQRLTALMSTDEGIRILEPATEIVINEWPHSLIVIYARAVALARTDRLEAATALVNSATTAVAGGKTGEILDDKARKATLKHLANIWRVVDAIARDKMAWAAGGADANAEGASEDAGEADGEAKAGAEDQPSDDQSAEAPIAQEVLLQGRLQGRYLVACRRQFQAAPDLRGKLIAIKAMLRQGLRRVPAYHDAYEEARRAYRAVRSLWTPMLAGEDGAVAPALLARDNGLRTVRMLIQVLHLARDLHESEDVAAIEATLMRFGELPQARTTVWTIASVLVDGDPDRFTAPTTELVLAAGPPRKPHEVRDFLAWAARARRHDLAHDFARNTSGDVMRSYSAIHYVKILQRDGAFDQALKLLEIITGHVLATPKAFCPFRHWGLIKRAVELRFLVDSARWMQAVPQPTDPCGVVLIAPRNAGQLTKYPMAVLLELKKQGWAIIPLVEGVLPREPTGNPRIDQFIGCLLLDVRLDPRIEAAFEPIHDYAPRIDQGELKWGDMDLSQPLWEEGAINRRRFSVDFTCPSLQKFLSRLVEWTRLQGVALHNANRVFGEMKLRTAAMTPSQYRLPDALNRFYCEHQGDPKMFFCAHTSNGYENYFANFSRPVSTKTVIRNITAHPELRTASFPIPAEFEAWYQGRRAEGAEMLERVRDTTKVRRSTRTTATPPPEALACLERARRWKAEGGHVACAFGKVVCDMGAPTDGGPAHRNMKDWLNHTVDSVRGSRTLLLIKPHPHELRNEIATFLTEYMVDLIEVDIPDNVVIVGQDWFDIHELDGLVELGLLYNGTTAVELGLMNIPAVLCSNFAPTDYPIGHIVPTSRADYRKLVRFEKTAKPKADLPERAAAWIHYMSGDLLTIPYRYHARPLTNKVVMPPRWFEDDIRSYLRYGDPNVTRLSQRVTDLPKRRQPARKTAAKTPPRVRSVPTAKKKKASAASTPMPRTRRRRVPSSAAAE